MSIQFTRTDLKTELIRRDPTLEDLDSTKFTNKVKFAEKSILAQFQSNYIQTEDPFVKGDTFASSLSSGTAASNTSLYDVYQIALPAGARAVAGNTIWVWIVATGTFYAVPRTEIDSIVPASGAGQTVHAFHETKGYIILAVHDGDFTAPASVNIEYWRDLVPTTNDGDNLDIKPEDFEAFADAVAALIATE